MRPLPSRYVTTTEITEEPPSNAFSGVPDQQVSYWAARADGPLRDRGDYIVMERSGSSAEEALKRLKDALQEQGVMLV